MGQSNQSAGLAIARVVAVPNAVLIAVASLVLTIVYGVDARVGPLVVTDGQTKVDIESLERAIRSDPADGTAALALARIYERAGESSWSYDALRRFEAEGGRDARTRLLLGIAYLEIGRNGDGQRVLRQAVQACRLRRCPPGALARLEIMVRAADVFVGEGIDARRDYGRVDAAWRQVLKPVVQTAAAADNRFQDGRRR